MTTAAPPPDPTRRAAARPGTGLMILIGLAAATLAMAGLQSVANIAAPVFFALTLAISVRPLTKWLTARHVPRPLATLLVLVLMYAVLLGMFFVVGLSIAELAQTLPNYSARFTQIYTSVLEFIGRFGVKRTDVDNMLQNFDFARIVDVAQTLLGQLSSISALAVELLLALAFLLIDTASVGDRARRLRRVQPNLVAALEDFSWRVRKYWVVSAIFGVFLAIGDYAALLIIGVPMALTWAVLAFIANFVPNIGFALAVIPPALLALLAGNTGKMIAVLVAYTVVSIIFQSILLPKFMGDAVGLNVTTTFVSLLFWTSIMGPVGAILAIPLTLFFKAVVIESTPSLHWVDVFLASDQPPPGGRTQVAGESAD